MPTIDNNNVPISAPSVEVIKTISLIADPVNRNLQITDCYCVLSNAFARRTGTGANWCTFATWASKQAGVTIRGEDMKRTLYNVLKDDREIQELLALIASHAKKLGGGEALKNIQQTAVGKIVKSAAERASDAVARGNKKVYEEIGYEFARFIATCMKDEIYTESTIADFCKSLSTGPPPGGQDYLRKAFTRYYSSFFESNPKRRDELRYLANIEIGFHEQTRLQPEIAASLNAGAVDPQHVRDYVSDLLVKSKSIIGKILYFFQWIMGKTGLFKKAIDSLVIAAEKKMRIAITEHLMTITIPPNNILRLGKDLFVAYPDDLLNPENPELVALLAKLNSTPGLPGRNAATDWSVLEQRMRFIADLFRCYHVSKDLFNNAFTEQQIAIIKSGGMPAGLL